MTTTYYIACDLGTDHGRIILGSLTKGQLTLQEVATFPIRTRTVKGVLCWDLAALEKDIFAGIARAAALGLPIAGLSANSWDGDFVLLDGKDRPLQLPACGAGLHAENAAERLLKKLPLSTIYAETGTPLLPLHTLFQIEGRAPRRPGALPARGAFPAHRRLPQHPLLRRGPRARNRWPAPRSSTTRRPTPGRQSSSPRSTCPARCCRAWCPAARPSAR